jgi:hypothetical protein
MPHLTCHYLYISFIYCTYWVSTISVFNLAIFPCYSNLPLRRRRWIGILWWGVLGYVLPRLSFLWCYGVFHYSVLLRVILVFKDIIYVIIILYIRDIWLSVDTFSRMCGTIDPGSCIRWVLSFGIKTGYDSAGSRCEGGLAGGAHAGDGALVYGGRSWWWRWIAMAGADCGGGMHACVGHMSSSHVGCGALSSDPVKWGEVRWGEV